MKILFIGDIDGRVGREVVFRYLNNIKQTENVDFIIANGENVTHGKGLSEEHYYDLLDMGINVVTLGNHYAAKKELLDYIVNENSLLRPNNLHPSIPGKGSNVYSCKGVKIRVTNLLGRAFMAMDVNNPFDDLNKIVENDNSDIHIVDFHAEATGEKYALAYAFDGKISALLGTHTHIQTNDAHLLPKGTAVMADVGMCGAYDSILGVTSSDVVQRTWTGFPTPFTVKEDGPAIFSGALLTFNDETHKVEKIEAIKKIFNEGEY